MSNRDSRFIYPNTDGGLSNLKDLKLSKVSNYGRDSGDLFKLRLVFQWPTRS